MIKQLSERHIIQKQSIEILFENISDGFGLQNRIAELFYEKLLPEIELLFDEFADDEHLISFETLTLDCGVLSHPHWEEEWVTETVRGLRRELFTAQKIKKEKAAKVAKLLDDFLYFLQTGRLPWNSVVASINELEQIEKDHEFLKRLKVIIKEKQKTTERLVYNFSDEFVNSIIKLLIKEKRENEAAILKWKNETEVNQKKQQLALIQKLCYEQQNKNETATKESKEKAIEPEELYVHNAGLVLLHPFLQELFISINLFTEQHWNDDVSAHTAAIVMEYLVSGSGEYPEFNLPLNKILCGLTPGEVIVSTKPLPDTMKKECDDLLQVVIQYWSALKNTGIEALRETFLQRNGKLTKVDNGWLLNVEQKAVDVLLGQLPWGIGVIKLPWMKTKLYVEWV